MCPDSGVALEVLLLCSLKRPLFRHSLLCSYSRMLKSIQSIPVYCMLRRFSNLLIHMFLRSRIYLCFGVSERRRHAMYLRALLLTRMRVKTHIILTILTN